MKMLIYSDVHWSEYSSIVRGNHYPYTERLCNLINSVNWAEEQAKNFNVDYVINLGDFFDKPTLSPLEITALNKVQWYDECEHYVLVGNHEMWSHDLKVSSAHLFELLPKSRWTVIDEPSVYQLSDKTFIGFLPYTLEQDVEEAQNNLIDLKIKPNDLILFSHNDLKGIQMGSIISKQGFSLEVLNNNCRICFNGHLHNGMKVSSNVINVGNLTGQNFGEDATLYMHGVYLYDTQTDKCQFIENPFAYNFYKAEYPDMPIFKKQAVVSYKCPVNKEPDIRKLFESDGRIEAFRIILAREQEKLNEESLPDLSVDHLEEFRNYILSTIGNDEVVQQELYEVCK